MDDGIVVVAAVVTLSVFLVYGVVRRYVPTYNAFVELEEDVENARSDVDSLLQRRRDELNRLYVAAREATGHESSTLSDVVGARQAVDAGGAGERPAGVDEQALRALTQFDARAEEYPEITAVENVETLQENVVKIEEELAERREEYNATVTEYNKRVRKFPGSVVASLGNFERREQFTPSESIGRGDQLAPGPAAEPAMSLDGSAGDEPAIERPDGESPPADPERDRPVEPAESGDRSDDA